MKANNYKEAYTANRLRICNIQYNLLLSVDEIIQIFRIYWKH